jgi:acetyl-CoA carboxylase beta subunit
MSAILITITADGATVADLPSLPARARRAQTTKTTCPKCGSVNLRHRLHSRWHDCKRCHHTFAADCSRRKHGGSLG